MILFSQSVPINEGKKKYEELQLCYSPNHLGIHPLFDRKRSADWF